MALFQLRPEHMRAFSEVSTNEANRKLVTYARKRFPAEFRDKSEEEALALVKRVRGTALAYRIEKENDVATFLDLTVMYGEDFHKANWASDMLNLHSQNGPDKMAVLRYRVNATGVRL